jgi:hypothetical protein
VDQAKALPLYEKLVATHAGIELKGATIPYTSLNGHMTSALHKDGTVALRLPSPMRETFLKKYRTTLVKQYGVVQREYVVVPDALLVKTSELKPYFAASVGYVATLKPKPTGKRPKPKKRVSR